MTIDRLANPEDQQRLTRIPIILSALWAARAFCSLQGDAVRLSDPTMLNGLINGAAEFQGS